MSIVSVDDMDSKRKKDSTLPRADGGSKKPGRGKRIIKIVSFAVLAAVMLAIGIISIPIVRMLSTPEGRQGLERLVEENYLAGLIVYLVLQMLQIVVAIIPGGVIQILGGVLFDKLLGTVWCLLGVFLGELVVFLLVRRFGMPVVEAFIDKKGIKRLEFLNDSKKLELAVFILFLIPGVPKDALTYIAPLTRIKPSSFFLLSMLARSPAIIMSTFFGANLGEGNILEAVILFALVAVFGIIGVLYSDRILMLVKDKKEDLKEDLKKIRKK